VAGEGKREDNDKVKAVSGALTQVMDVYHFVLGTCCPFHATDILMCCCRSGQHVAITTADAPQQHVAAGDCAGNLGL